MKKGINLLKKKEEHSSIDDSIKKINTLGIGAGVVIFIVVVAISLLNIQFSRQLTDLTKQRNDLQASYLKQRTVNNQINYIADKKNQLQTFMQEDSKYGQYYQMFTELFVANEIPTFTALNIDNARQTTFKFNVTTTEDFQKVLAFLESDAFLDNFDGLTISTAAIDPAAILLEFKGTLKNVQPAI